MSRRRQGWTVGVTTRPRAHERATGPTRITLPQACVARRRFLESHRRFDKGCRRGVQGNLRGRDDPVV